VFLELGGVGFFYHLEVPVTHEPWRKKGSCMVF
jgi:hypothetical protein